MTYTMTAAAARGVRRRIILAALVAGAALTAVPLAIGPATDADEAWSAFQAFYHQLVDEHHIVGSSVTVVHDNHVVRREMTGFQNLHGEVPVDEDTIFHWASITKTFTGIAIMQLRDRGLLDLDDPIERYVPEFRAVYNPFGDATQITIRHLMTHSSGLRGGTWPWGGDQPWHPFEPPGYDQLVAMLPYTQIEFDPGSRYRYSNPGIIFLGMTIERLADEPFETYIDKHILKPLEMHRSYFDTSPRHLRPHRSHSYRHGESGLEEARFDFNTGVTVSNGGLNAPMPDMVRYVNFLMGQPGRAREHAHVLTRGSLDEMFAPQIGRSAQSPDLRSGLIFFLERFEGRELAGHTGSQNGFYSNLWIDLASRTASIVVCNTPATTENDGHFVDRELRHHLVREVYPTLGAGS